MPTEDADAWLWYPGHRWVYDKLAVALSQGLEAAPHGVMPARFPVFSKPIVNLRGMGTGSRLIESAAEYRQALTPGHFWMTHLEGEHVSTDMALVREAALVSAYDRPAGARRHLRSLDRSRRLAAGP